MARELEIRAHGGAEEHSGRARANPANELGKRFLRCTNVALGALALSGPAAVAGVAAGTAVMAQAREAKAQLEGIQTLSLEEMQAALRMGRALSRGQDTYIEARSRSTAAYTTGATVEAQEHGIIISVVSDPGHPEREGYALEVRRPDGVSASREYRMTELRDLYRQATGEDFLFVTIGIEVEDSPDGYVEAYIIPSVSRNGEVQSGIPFKVMGYDFAAGQFERLGTFQTQ